MTVHEIIIVVLHRFLNGQRAGLCAFVQLLLRIQSVPVSNARVRRATGRPRNEKRH